VTALVLVVGETERPLVLPANANLFHRPWAVIADLRGSRWPKAGKLRAAALLQSAKQGPALMCCSRRISAVAGMLLTGLAPQSRRASLSRQKKFGL
jgi:hypothetical protein